MQIYGEDNFFKKNLHLRTSPYQLIKVEEKKTINTSAYITCFLWPEEIKNVYKNLLRTRVYDVYITYKHKRAVGIFIFFTRGADIFS